MLPGVVPFPPEFAKRYRERGYWRDKSLAQEFREVFDRYGDRVGLIDANSGRAYTYGELDRVVVQLPNVGEFVVLYLALQKIGAIPIAALVTHRYAEISQFTQLSGATSCVTPDRWGDFDYTAMVGRIQAESATLRYPIVLGAAPSGFASLTELIEKPATASPARLGEIEIDPTDPCIFQLSGGTTGIRSSSRGRTTITLTIRSVPPKSARSALHPSSWSSYRSPITCRWRVRGFRACCSTAARRSSRRAPSRTTSARSSRSIGSRTSKSSPRS